MEWVSIWIWSVRVGCSYSDIKKQECKLRRGSRSPATPPPPLPPTPSHSLPLPPTRHLLHECSMSSAVTYVVKFLYIINPDSPTGLSIDSSPRTGGGRCDAEADPKAVCYNADGNPSSLIPPRQGCEYEAVWREPESSEHVLMSCYFIYNQVMNQ